MSTGAAPGSAATSGIGAVVVGGVLAAAAFAFSPGVWEFATHAEVFSLNNCLCLCVAHALARFFATGARADAALAVLFGDGKGNAGASDAPHRIYI